MIDLVDFAGHVSYVFLACGAYLLGRKNKWGWLCHIIGGLGWLIIGFIMEMSSLWTWGFVFLFIDIKGFRNWWKWEGKHDD